MQIFKISLWIGALALCTGMALHAQDTAAQAAARAALQQKMQELEGHSAVAVPSKPVENTQVAAQPIDRQLGDDAAQAKARAALLQKIQELEGKPAATAAPKPAPMVAPVATAPVATTPVAAQPVVNMQPDNNEAQARARAALNQKMAELGTPSTPTIITTTAPTTSAPVKVQTQVQGQTPTMQPIVAPALPITLSKQEKLQWLLNRYKADQISPEQYHEQRAAILAEP